MKPLDRYKQLERKAQLYYASHKALIEAELKKERATTIKQKFPDLNTVSVWCRNGNVIHKATHCNLLICQYKAEKADVIKGCCECQNFQITTIDDNWETAKHINIFDRVN